MTLLYAATFTKALGQLTAAEQKQVKVSTMDLMLDPAGNGLQLHRVEAAPGFWTARVSQDIRLVLHKESGRTLLAYVDHHDAAYRWAERRRLVPHERTGAMQFVEVVETQEERPVSPVKPEAAALPVTRPFAALSDDQLLDVGVPRDWLEPVRQAEEASVDGLFEALPAEAAEALLDYLTGGRLEDHVAAMGVPGDDPFAHPDAQRRFREVAGVEELRAALDAPFAQWAVFLHPAQRAPVERAWSGPARISGSAGTGKTIVALHRAQHLAADEGARVLLTTFSRPLAANLAEKAELMLEAMPDRRGRVTVQALDDAALAQFAAATGRPASLATSAHIRAAIAAAMAGGLGAGLSSDFLFEEWEEVVDAWGLAQAEDYAQVPRLGRKTRLGPRQRETAWAVFERVRSALAAEGLITWAGIYAWLTRQQEEAGGWTFTHMVVDEAQDLSVAQARLLAAAGRGRADALFFTGDLGQRIFHLPFSWAKLGLDVRGRSQVLKVCYRTSHQIRTLADRLLAPEIVDVDGLPERRNGTVSVFDGPEPVFRLFDDEAAEIEAVAAWLSRCLADGIAPAELAVLVRGVGQVDRARAVLDAVAKPLAIIPMHDAKGLEFRAVAVMAVDEDVLPDPARLAEVGDLADLEAIGDTERHLLYVACTRARDRLMISGLAPGSEFLDDLQTVGKMR